MNKQACFGNLYVFYFIHMRFGWIGMCHSHTHVKSTDMFW